MDYVFDFDGTIAKDGVISKTNIDALSKINNKILNTSRSFEDLPDSVKNIFERIVCLNGSLFYVNGKLVNKEIKINKQEWETIVDFAKKNKYNIGINSTKRFCNVTNEESIKFMNAKGISHRSDIPEVDDIYLVSISDPTEVRDLPIDIHFARMSKRFIEISHNNKGNITFFTNDFIAFGDGENDKPMYAKAKSFKVIGKDIKYSDSWIKEAFNE